MHIQPDWIQISAISKTYVPSFDRSNYKITTLPFSTRHFKIVEEFEYEGRRVATVLRCPGSSIINAETIHVKFDNWLLYAPNCNASIINFLEHNQLKFQRFSRLDLCHDFQIFSNGLQPQELLNQFVSEKLIHIGKSKFTIHGETLTKLEHQYLKFGSNSSDVCAYLYNKTKELEQVKDKPYIRSQWKEFRMNEDRNVWRLEFSFKNSNLQFTDNETGENIDLKTLALLAPTELLTIYQSAQYKYFNFAYPQEDKNRARWKKERLFDYEFKHRHIHKFDPRSTSNRTDKLVIKKMNESYNELREVSVDLSQAFAIVQDTIAMSKNLLKWREIKGFTIHPPAPTHAQK